MESGTAERTFMVSKTQVDGCCAETLRDQNAAAESGDLVPLRYHPIYVLPTNQSASLIQSV